MRIVRPDTAFADKPRRRAEKKPAYLSFLHTLPCCVTGQSGVQAAHLSFADPWYGHYGRGRGTKAPDLFALPLSPEQHSKSHSMNEEAYWLETGVNPHLLALTLFAIWSNYDEYDATERATARILAGIRQSSRKMRNK